MFLYYVRYRLPHKTALWVKVAATFPSRADAQRYIDTYRAANRSVQWEIIERKHRKGKGN